MEQYKENGDVLLPSARKLVLSHPSGTFGILQKELGIGYSRAAQLLSTLSEEGLISLFGQNYHLTVKGYSEIPPTTNDKPSLKDVLKRLLYYGLYAGWGYLGIQMAASQDGQTNWPIKVVGFFAWLALPWWVSKNGKSVKQIKEVYNK